MFGQRTTDEDVTVSAVARFDPLENEWKILGGYGPAYEKFSVVNNHHGVVIADGDSANAKPKLCQISDTGVDCEGMGNNDQASTLSDGEIILFTFDHTKCPMSVDLPSMLLLDTSYNGAWNELIRKS